MVKKIQDRIAELLPEGIDENLVAKIAKLVGDKLNEEVEKTKKGLTSKFITLLKANIDMQRDFALKELEQTNEAYRDSEKFKLIKGIMAVENTPEDELLGINAQADALVVQEGKLTELSTEIERLAQESTRLENIAIVLNDKNETLTNENKSLAAKLKELEAKLAGKGNSSDAAIVVSEENFKSRDLKKVVVEKQEKEKPKQRIAEGNEFLTDDIMEGFNALGKK